MEKVSDKFGNIPGWGIDADPANEPTYPIKNYTGDDHDRLHYERPPQQRQTTEILHSNERPGLPAVFGSSLPPSGLSGVLRRFAFRYSEGTFTHWLTLLLADRINVYEGLLQDLGRGKLPNIFAERGWKAIYKYDKKLFAQKVAVTSIITAVIIVLFFRKRRR
jgi:hypothetical protein